MISPEKIVLILCLLAGFLWIRQRSRSIDLESQKGRALFGVFALLPLALLLEKHLFEMFHFGMILNILLKCAILIATFLIVGFGFLRSGNLEGTLAPNQKEA
jgi:hypothetical protein